MSIINNTLVAYDISYQELDLIVTLLMTVFTFVIVIFNFGYLLFIYNTNPTYIRAKEIHSEKIKEIASNWNNEISNIMETLGHIREKPDKYCAKVENEYFFNDLKEHDPQNLNVFKTWDEFKRKIDEIRFLQFDLIEKINDKINSQTGLIYNNDFNSPCNIFTYDITMKIWMKLEKIYNGENFESYSVDKFKINGNEEIEGKYYEIITGFAKATHESQGIDKLQTFLTTKLKNTIDEEGWNDDFKKINETYSQLNPIRVELNKKIDEFKSMPIFPEDCEIMKRIKKPFFWIIKNKFKKNN